MPKPTVKQVRLAGPETEISIPFIQGMIDRMMVSYHKYGPVADATHVNCPATAWECLAAYHRDGNTEHLIDAANYLMMEFMKNPDNFRPTDSDGSVGRVDDKGVISVRPN